ncbi:acetyl/propionyl/methylcrotonyl-CoA carboxylase subunit alpha [Acidiferrimicrobium sp. IK]|uniref:acetyl/propionyl/methylcrotonyl-CoA carboxylase subunit alpha n=1 Tax=Acidiferrimicrobium sp. IK TaxID=2871700 RepID=UPI0021CB4093|nr:biotin carboxylase N-terminal domain-containing protein [Acidiferrimicrobium sp. IK]
MTPTPIRRLLIANRGEIARRVMRSAAQMGIATVAVYAPSDAAAPFVAEADTAVALRGSSPAETYLDAEQLLAAADAAGADAVHPGYGFLSERASFAQAVIDAGLTWVGPPPAAIAAMGDKLAAKDLMAAAGVPVLASHRVGDGALPAIPAAEFPVLVKAAAGGGGKGMRVVAGPGDLAGAVEAAQREALRAFGDPTVFVERYLPDARHVEVQILADGHGTVVHVFERECSIQRRHQKIIEEAPSPAVDPALRSLICAAAVDAARAVGYRSAGTVEFVLDASPSAGGAFYFLEVNTRLQVEHPVTEAVTGLDLVREQLRVAAGHPLSFGQADLRLDGHAIEARVYAEDPAAGFLPATGTLVEWAVAASPAVRVDSGVETGTAVGVEWDPMLAKVVAHAPTREEAALSLALALERLRVRGVTTNRDYLVAVLRSAEFLAGHTTTSFVERVALPRRRDVDDATLGLCALAAALAAQARRAAAAPVLRSLPSGWRNSDMPPERAGFSLGTDPSRAVTVSYRRRRDGAFDVVVAGAGEPAARTALIAGLDGRQLDLVVDGVQRRFDVLDTGTGRCFVQGPAGDVELRVAPRFPDRRADEAGGALNAPMPGRVLAVHVEPGDVVAAGSALVVMEAMKMEHRVNAPHDGTVAAVPVAAGDQVSAGDVLVVLDAPAADTAPLDGNAR